MAVDPTSFKIRYPEFVNETDIRVQFFLDDAALMVDSGAWGGFFDRGLAALCAHYLALDIRKRNSDGTGQMLGNINRRKVGDVETGFGALSPTNTQNTPTYYMQTEYGVDYWSLVQSISATALAVQ